MTRQLNPALAIVFAIGLYLLVTSAFFPINSLSVFDAKRIIQLGLFAAVLGFSVAWAPLRNATISQLSRLSLTGWVSIALFFLIGLVSSLRLTHPSYALVDVSMFFIMAILVAVVAGSRELAGKTFDRIAVLALVFVGLAVSVQEFTGFLVGWVQGTEFSYNQALIHFAHPRFYNQFQTWSIPIIAALPLIFPGKRYIKIGCIVLLGLQWFLVIAYAARGTTVSLLISMVFVAIWLGKQRNFWLKYQIAGVLTAIILYFGILSLNGHFASTSPKGEFYAHSVGRPMMHTSGRSMLWRLSIEDGLKHPILGTGPTRYACNSDIVLPAHPHSILFRIMGEWGLLAFAGLLIFVITIGFRFLKGLKLNNNTDKTESPLKSILAISLISGAIHACLSGLLIMPASQVTMILVLGWALSSLISPDKPQATSALATLTLLISFLIACTTLIFATTEIFKLPERTNYSSSYGPAVPKFWQDGRVCLYSYGEANQ